MHHKSLTNLKPWTKGVTGNPSGRRVGSRNIATIVQELLEQDIDITFPLNDKLKELVKVNGT